MIRKVEESNLKRNSKIFLLLSSFFDLFGGFIIWLGMYFFSFLISSVMPVKQEAIFSIFCLILFVIVGVKSSSDLLGKINDLDEYSEESLMPIVTVILLLLITGILSLILNTYFFTIWYVVSCISLTIIFFLKKRYKK